MKVNFISHKIHAWLALVFLTVAVSQFIIGNLRYAFADLLLAGSQAALAVYWKKLPIGNGVKIRSKVAEYGCLVRLRASADA